MTKEHSVLASTRGVFFDLDGTLIDSVEIFLAAYRYAIKHGANIDISENQITDALGPNEAGVIKSIAGEKWEHCLELFYQFESNSIESISTFFGIENLLKFSHANGARIALITGRGERHANLLLDRFGLRQYFSSIKYGDEDRWNKSDSIRDTATEPGVAISDTVYIGDSSSDVVAALESGSTPILANWSKRLEVSAAVRSNALVFDSPNELLAWLKCWLTH